MGEQVYEDVIAALKFACHQKETRIKELEVRVKELEAILEHLPR